MRNDLVLIGSFDDDDDINEVDYTDEKNFKFNM